MILPEQLEGYGLALRRWRPEDAEVLHDAVIGSLEHLRPWMEWAGHEPLTVEQRRAMLEGWERDWRAGGDVAYGVFVDGGAVAGGCGLHHRAGPARLEIGYWTHPAFLRRGMASAASRLLTDAAFSIPGVEVVEIHHDRANWRSRGVPEGLGYQFVGEVPDDRVAPAEVGIDCTWRMTREAWLPRGLNSRSVCT